MRKLLSLFGLRSSKDPRRLLLPFLTASAQQQRQKASKRSAIKDGAICQTCQCCGKADSSENMMRIDSGQLLCPQCLKELRRKIQTIRNRDAVIIQNDPEVVKTGL